MLQLAFACEAIGVENVGRINRGVGGASVGLLLPPFNVHKAEGKLIRRYEDATEEKCVIERGCESYLVID